MDNMNGSGTNTRWPDFVNSHPIYDTSGNALTATYFNGYYHVKPFSIINNSNKDMTVTSATAIYNMGVIGEADIVLGTGSTAVLSTDYTLSGSQILTLTPLTTSYIKTGTGNQLNRIVQNLTSSAITVSEVGVVTRLCGLTSSVSTAYPILIFRQVLDTPLVIQPDEIKIISIDLR